MSIDQLLLGFSIGVAFCAAALCVGKGCVEVHERDRRIRIATERARLMGNVKTGHFNPQAWPERAL